MKALSVVGGALVTSAIGGEARAEDQTATRSHGWQTLAVDGAAVAVTVTGVATSFDSWPQTTLLTRLLPKGRSYPDDVLLTDVGIGLYTFGAPLVHAVHGRPLPGLASVAMRVAGPTAGLVVGAFFGGIVALVVGDCSLMKGCRNDEAADAAVYSGVGVGMAAGFVGPILVDALYLAREPAPKDAPAPPSASALRFVPRVALTPAGGTIGLSLPLD